MHADIFPSPTADLADIVLPVASPFETEALRVGFEVSQQEQSHVQLRRPVVTPSGEACSDLQIVFALAERLGLGRWRVWFVTIFGRSTVHRDDR